MGENRGERKNSSSAEKENLKKTECILGTQKG